MVSWCHEVTDNGNVGVKVKNDGENNGGSEDGHSDDVMIMMVIIATLSLNKIHLIIRVRMGQLILGSLKFCLVKVIND